MENFDLRKYLAENKLIKEDRRRIVDYDNRDDRTTELFLDNGDSVEVDVIELYDNLKENNPEDLAENKLYKDDVWYIEASEDSADIEQAGPKYKEAVINIIKAKHPDITDKDLEQSIEVTNSFWYDEARNNAKGSEPEEIEVSAEEFANSSIEYYEDALM